MSFTGLANIPCIYNSLIMRESEKNTICKMAIVEISNHKVVCIAETVYNDVDNATVAMISAHRVLQIRHSETTQISFVEKDK